MGYGGSMDRSVDEYRQQDSVRDERAGSMRKADGRSRVSKWVHEDGYAGVWSAAMMLPCALVPLAAWFVAPIPTRGMGALNWMLGALGLCGAGGLAWCLMILARARRVRRSRMATRLQWLAMAGLGLGVLAFVAPIAVFEEPLALIARYAWAGPATVATGCAFAVVRIAKGRHGTGIARMGGALCVLAALAPFVIDWPLVSPLVFIVAAVCVGLAGVRLWRHYELALVQGVGRRSSRAARRGR